MYIPGLIVRQFGVRLLFMMDDSVRIESSKERAKMQAEAINSILIGLGTVLNVPDPEGKKAKWLPEQKVKPSRQQRCMPALWTT